MCKFSGSTADAITDYPQVMALLPLPRADFYKNLGDSFFAIGGAILYRRN
jgi:hypothetical protein